MVPRRAWYILIKSISSFLFFEILINIASMGAVLFTHPLDTIKVQLQTQQQVNLKRRLIKFYYFLS